MPSVAMPRSMQSRMVCQMRVDSRSDHRFDGLVADMRITGAQAGAFIREHELIDPKTVRVGKSEQVRRRYEMDRARPSSGSDDPGSFLLRILGDESAADGKEGSLLDNRCRRHRRPSIAVHWDAASARRAETWWSGRRPDRGLLERNGMLCRREKCVCDSADGGDGGRDLSGIDGCRLIARKPSRTARSVPWPRPVRASEPYKFTCTRSTFSSRPCSASPRANRQAARMGPMVCELEGPTPILYRSKRLVILVYTIDSTRVPRLAIMRSRTFSGNTSPSRINFLVVPEASRTCTCPECGMPPIPHWLRSSDVMDAI